MNIKIKYHQLKPWHKTRYLYNRTPHGLEEKARVTARFLKQKLHEYEKLKEEIEQLRHRGETEK